MDSRCAGVAMACRSGAYRDILLSADVTKAAIFLIDE